MPVNFFILLHLLFTLLFYCLMCRKNRQAALCCGILVLIVPLFGFLYYCIDCCITSRIKGDSAGLYANRNKKQPKSDKMTMINYNEDAIPIKDVISLSGLTHKRDILIDTIRQNLLTDYDTLLEAMHDQDREVSHYAVSVVTYRADSLENAIFSMDKKVYDEAGNITADSEELQKYEELLNTYRKICPMDEAAQKKMLQKHEKIIAEILKKIPAEKYFEKIIELQLQQKKFTDAENFCFKYKDAFPTAEAPRLLYLKLAVCAKNQRQLKQAQISLRELLPSLSKEGLDIMRYWAPGAGRDV